MKTLRITEPFKVEVIDTEKPEVKEGEALLRILYGGICGSDLGSYRGTYAYVDYPRIPGHEFSAEIVEVGPNDYGLKPGMIVTGNPYYNCGGCYSCQRGMVNCCQDNHTLGCQIDGAFSEYFSMPVERIYDGKGIDAKTLTLVEPYCIAAHGVKRASVTAEDKVLVVGAGAIGIMALISAKRTGAKVYVADVAMDKLEGAKNFGADGVILNDEHFLEHVMEATDGHGFDAVIEAVGLPETFQACVDACAFGGRFSLVGIGKKPLNFDFTVIQKKELNIFGSRNALKEDFTQAIDDIIAGKLNLNGVITKISKLDDAAALFEEFHQNQGSMLKVMLEF